MSDQPLIVGDVVTATVTKSVPFGVLVEYAGVPGLVRSATGGPGADLSVRVTEYDEDAHRFTGVTA